MVYQFSILLVDSFQPFRRSQGSLANRDLRGRSLVEGTDGGESTFKSLVEAVRFCYRKSAFVLRFAVNGTGF